jgi:hypothetical protein
MGQLEATRKQVDLTVSLMNNRYYWVDVMTELRQILMRVEAATKAKLRTDSGVWIERFQSDFPPGVPAPTITSADPSVYVQYAPGRWVDPRMYMTSGQPTNDVVNLGTNGIVNLVFRAVRLDSVSSEANKELAFSVVNEIKNCGLFDATNMVPGSVTMDTMQTNTFTFELSAKLKRPLKP